MSTPVVRWIRPHLNEHATRTALDILSSTERARYDGLTDDRRDSFLAGRLVLRRLAAELTGLPPEAIEIDALCPDCGGTHGKPELVGSDLHVSLSRSADAVVAAASWDGPVGIDIESAPPSPDALAAIGALTGEASALRWTRVEAILKADGRGLRVDPAQVSVAAVHGHLEGWVADSPARYELSEVELAPDLRVSVAVAL